MVINFRPYQFIKIKGIQMTKSIVVRTFIDKVIFYLLIKPFTMCSYSNPSIVFFKECLWLDRIRSRFSFPLVNLLRVSRKSLTSFFIETQVSHVPSRFLIFVISWLSVSLLFYINFEIIFKIYILWFLILSFSSIKLTLNLSKCLYNNVFTSWSSSLCDAFKEAAFY